MHSMLRTFSGPGAKAFAKLMDERRPELEKIVKSISGLESYSFVETSDGCFSVSFGTKAGVDAMHKTALAWIKENAADTKVQPPTVYDGTVIFHI